MAIPLCRLLIPGSTIFQEPYTIDVPYLSCLFNYSLSFGSFPTSLNMLKCLHYKQNKIKQKKKTCLTLHFTETITFPFTAKLLERVISFYCHYSLASRLYLSPLASVFQALSYGQSSSCSNHNNLHIVKMNGHFSFTLLDFLAAFDQLITYSLKCSPPLAFLN